MDHDQSEVMGAVELLLARAKADAALRQRLLKEPKETITTETGLAVPDDWDPVAHENGDVVTIEFANGELPDDYLQLVAGGCTCDFRDQPLPPGVKPPARG
ncbi:MAG: hypothetical protein RJB01_1528 [Actinomycetota bacterium]